MNNHVRNQVLLGMCLVLSVFVAVLSLVDGSTLTAVLMSVAAVCAVAAMVTYHRRSRART